MKTFHEWLAVRALLETHWSEESEWPEDEEESESEHNEKLMVVDLVKRLLKAGRDHHLRSFPVYSEKWKGQHLHKAIQKAAKKLNMDVDHVNDMWWDVAVSGSSEWGKSSGKPPWHDIHPDHRRDKDLSHSDPVTPTFAKDDFEKLHNFESQTPDPKSRI